MFAQKLGGHSSQIITLDPTFVTGGGTLFVGVGLPTHDLFQGIFSKNIRGVRRIFLKRGGLGESTQ